MRRLLVCLTVLSLALAGAASVLARGRSGSGRAVIVRGYVKKDGTYVAPHYRSAPDGDPYNNWSTKGNVNPYTGAEGTKNPYPATSYRIGPDTAPYAGGVASPGIANPPGYKPSAAAYPETKLYTVLLEPDLADWGQRQPGGLSGLVRRLVRQERERLDVR